jgi:two-component system KDP operon response regulator KdpE
MPSNPPLVLLIEDEAPIRRFLRASLGAQGFRLVEAETAQKGLRIAAQQPPDMVILDLGLPDGDGQDVLRQLREWLRAPIIVLSARGQ